MTSARRRRNPALILLVIVAAAGCLALGWWQWTRFEAVGGTGQNLGYALQWPLFAAFVLYAYRRFVQLEAEAHEPEKNSQPRLQREIPSGLLPERPIAHPSDDLDTATTEYNRYLAELAARDTKGTST
ncbi:hypothetical protein [Antrihabitans sp. YC2-6]|uniref:hypothetical protein n=1 Tax=Antrihabitans sp. YC2-6 TaxID=2799498 RepID=UPI0018F441F5|nr:hypothetical protein [Antrihabitans sp. YC2-6]MBJ8346617.1 hypothetical protein [Antrihabitans sp. YC2-6]